MNDTEKKNQVLNSIDMIKTLFDVFVTDKIDTMGNLPEQTTSAKKISTLISQLEKDLQ